MKTSELTGASLDYYVAIAEGIKPYLFSGKVCQEIFDSHGLVYDYPLYSPSTDWAEGGVLIEQYKIQLDAPRDYMIDDKLWRADIDAGEENYFSRGETALEAICRVVVRAKFGDEVDDVG